MIQEARSRRGCTGSDGVIRTELDRVNVTARRKKSVRMARIVLRVIAQEGLSTVK